MTFIRSLKETWAIKFIYSNLACIIWFGLYFTIAWQIAGGGLNGFIIVAVIYGVSMTIALSPLGEIILQILQGCREPATEQEINYLLPIFEEVYEDAKEMNPSLNKKIKIYVMDEMYVNAFAMGRKTVIVTRGAMETLTADELKGLIAHEFGHMNYGHTKALLLTLIGNFFFSVIVWVLRLILRILLIICSIVANFNFLGIGFGILTFIVKIIVEVATFVFVQVGDIILAMNSRETETQADTFAYDIGYGKELTSCMYLLQKISMGAKLKLSERIKASHPHLAYRIQHLEKLESEGYEV